VTTKREGKAGGGCGIPNDATCAKYHEHSKENPRPDVTRQDWDALKAENSRLREVLNLLSINAVHNGTVRGVETYVFAGYILDKARRALGRE
jgi:hypothetical protein